MSPVGMWAAVAAGLEGPATLIPGMPLGSLSATRERPLFAPTRRPPPPVARAPLLPPAAAPVKAAIVEEPMRFALLGIIRAPDRGGSAVFMDEAARTSFSLKRGEAKRGWVLQSIDADAVTLAKDQRSVRLTYAKAPKAPVPPAAN